MKKHVSKPVVRLCGSGAIWQASGIATNANHCRRRRSGRAVRELELVQWDTSEHAWLEGRGEKNLDD